MSDLILEISRYKTNTFFTQKYKLAYQENKTILWWLTKINEELDSTLAFDCSCCAGLCGACGVRVNGRSVLACKTPLTSPLDSDVLEYRIEPLRGLPIIRDLMINWTSVIEHLKERCPWLTKEQDMDLTFQFAQSQAEATHDQALAECVLCGICASECPVLSQNHFIEPFVFIKAYRLISDSRLDYTNRQIILQNIQPFLAQCIHCGRCEDSCPKGTSPVIAIDTLKKYNNTLTSL